KIEVVADEVGPSVRWAVARPEKTDRRGGQGGAAPYSQQAYGGAQQGAGQAAYAPAGAPAAGGGGFDSDEEPF
ncbi:MAG TPA: hypothetical protein VMU14_12610, partial [Acidimicrobiales bacterium]|nr:hypothetical protein [Acidimicrobiales bacterium]